MSSANIFMYFSHMVSVFCLFLKFDCNVLITLKAKQTTILSKQQLFHWAQSPLIEPYLFRIEKPRPHTRLHEGQCERGSLLAAVRYVCTSPVLPSC